MRARVYASVCVCACTCAWVYICTCICTCTIQYRDFNENKNTDWQLVLNSSNANIPHILSAISNVEFNQENFPIKLKHIKR